jgi:hypothetical protein
MFRTAVLLTALSAAVFVGVSAQSNSGEARQRDFVILNDDGYGTSDCLAKASACGKIVADAWCESKGFARAVSYRPAQAEDMTQTVSTGRSLLNETFVISCSE